MVSYDCQVQDGRLLKQFAGTVGEGVSHGISSAIKKTTVSTLKQVQEQVAKTLPPDAKTTRHGVRASFASRLQGTLDKLASGEQEKDWVDPKSGPPPLPERIHKQGKRSIRQLIDWYPHPASTSKSSTCDYARPGAWSTYRPTTEKN